MKLLKRNWLSIFLVAYGAFIFLPFLAPVFMKWNLSVLGRAIYLAYSFVCHQLPERSLFFFGPKLMYSVEEIQVAWQRTADPLILRQFIGNPDMGWKVAWSDRMTSMYGGVWLACLLWRMLKNYNPKISGRIFLLLTLPMALDGFTHFFSDLQGLTEGFRYTNHWLASLTQNYFSSSFYVGDGPGSFNSWMRWLSGALFAFGLVWWALPYVGVSFDSDPQHTGNSFRHMNA